MKHVKVIHNCDKSGGGGRSRREEFRGHSSFSSKLSHLLEMVCSQTQLCQLR